MKLKIATVPVVIVAISSISIYMIASIFFGSNGDTSILQGYVMWLQTAAGQVQFGMHREVEETRQRNNLFDDAQ